MPSNDGNSSMSPVLFLSVKGEPMRFFLRPGATKVQLQPLIKAGGGVVCNVQSPGAILLADPEEMADVPALSMKRYVSTQYIKDCVEKNQQLEVDDYRFNDGNVRTRPDKRKRERLRMGYTPEEDSAILSFMSKRTHEARGNRVWKQMERQRVTGHSWQSMKDRYRKHLCQQLGHDVEAVRVPSLKMNPQGSPPNRDNALENTHLGASPEESSPESVSKTHQVPNSPEAARPECSSEERYVQPLPETTPSGSEDERSPSRSTADKAHLLGSSEGPVRKKHRGRSPENSCLRTPPKEGGALQKGTDRFEKRQVVVQNSKSTRTVVNPERKMEVQDKTFAPEKRKLGILEMAIMEFEDPDQTDEETPDLLLRNRPQADPQALAYERDQLMIPAQVTPDNSNHRNAQEEPQPETSDPQSHSADRSNGTTEKSVAPASNVNTFLTEHESQEEELTSDILFSQAQLEEAKQHLRNLMEESRQDLLSVTKALLKNSGDAQASLQYLLAGDNQATQGPVWTRHDDNLLSAHPARHELCMKYGEEGVARRIAFLDVE